MKVTEIPIYYVVRVYKDGSARIDSGPYGDYGDAHCAREEDHRWNAEDFSIMETFIEGEIL